MCRSPTTALGSTVAEVSNIRGVQRLHADLSLLISASWLWQHLLRVITHHQADIRERYTMPCYAAQA